MDWICHRHVLYNCVCLCVCFVARRLNGICQAKRNAYENSRLCPPSTDNNPISAYFREWCTKGIEHAFVVTVTSAPHSRKRIMLYRLAYLAAAAQQNKKKLENCYVVHPLTAHWRTMHPKPFHHASMNDEYPFAILLQSAAHRHAILFIIYMCVMSMFVFCGVMRLWHTKLGKFPPTEQ